MKFYFKTGVKISFFGSTAVTIFVVLLGRYICSLFGTDAVTRSYMLKVLPQFAVGFMATAVNAMISSYLYSTERSFLALSISVLRSIVVNAAVILILPSLFGEKLHHACRIHLMVENNLPFADYFGTADGRDNDKMDVAVEWEKGTVLTVPILCSSP
ncbi:MAG: hypothetical protein K2N87_19210, partial [Eubacterium sp.]|nr:hypothetical protein [Eubacterium sp.]